MKPEWLNTAVFYEVYPQSFQDSNGDGVGDLPGLLRRLDYIHDLGCNAIWINPCFVSPFVDAGYDVTDFRQVAPRYGTNQDLTAVFDKAHALGMHVLLDLVAGHTSNQCEWFRQSCLPERNAYSDRYIWTDSIWKAPAHIGSIMGWYRGGYDRDGAVACNFFTSQLALNYGFFEKDPDCAWEQDMEDPGPRATQEELKNIMAFWLDRGADGFRVDMAYSLIKNDPEFRGTQKLWRRFRAWLEENYPEAVLLSEWGNPELAMGAGFHLDFLLQVGPSHFNDLCRTAHPYFRKDEQGSLRDFWAFYQKNLQIAGEKQGRICIPSGNHDMDRMARTLDPDESRLAFAFLLTMPCVPFIYYGDEIGMRYVQVPHSVEGGFFRTGSRSPMQWDTSMNAGFSTAPAERLYIPQDTEGMKTINVESEEQDPGSLLHTVKELLALRQAHPALQSGSFTLLEPEYPLVYRRSTEQESLDLYFNVGTEERKAPLLQGQYLFGIGERPQVQENTLLLAPQSFAAYRK